MKKIIILLLITTPVFGQWKYESGGNFEGDFKSAYVHESNDKNVYLNIYKMNGKIGMYIAEINILDRFSMVSKIDCDHKDVFVRFDGENNLYILEVHTKEKYKYVWYLCPSKNNCKWHRNGPFINDIRSHSMMYVKIKNSCGETEYKFTLQGSSKAIDYVLK